MLYLFDFDFIILVLKWVFISHPYNLVFSRLNRCSQKHVLPCSTHHEIICIPFKVVVVLIWVLKLPSWRILKIFESHIQESTHLFITINFFLLFISFSFQNRGLWELLLLSCLLLFHYVLSLNLLWLNYLW